MIRLLSDVRDVFELLLLAAALWVVTWLAGLVGAELPEPVSVARAWVH